MIRRLLIANRGEIALRVMRTCRRMGIDTVAVYSDADAQAPHAVAADEAVRIGPAAAAQSYLNIEAILAAARSTGADAIHPGYGFLSENADFARACDAAGMTFVGPPAEAIERMGSKTASRETVSAAGVPVVPGATASSQTPEAIRAAVEAVGYPALLKAVAGGGGKGMRIVRTAAEVAEAAAAASRESARAFGDGTLYVERLIEQPRHVEVQIIGDRHGTILHLFERDCSLQRRHQKVIEEAPAPDLAAGVRRRLHDAAVAAARSVDYVNAGTIEFLLEGEGESARFYFLEMNTRLQVEHPVTEMITGLDLVELQLRVAAGEALPFAQGDVRTTGHAVECRVYAEDARTLLPQSGRLLRYREPHGEGVRVDAGVIEGQTITVHYDPMIAKLIAHGPTRGDAFARAHGALARYEILGLRHNVSFLRALVADEDVRRRPVSTSFIEEHFATLTAAPSASEWDSAAALAAFAAAGAPAAAGGGAPDGDATDADADATLDPWTTLGRIEW
jgi:acetyl-CoA carboxylase biotin carboxylase subunit